MRGGVLALGIVLLSPAQGAAEWQTNPFFGITFGGKTTLVEEEHAAGTLNVAFGATTVLLGEFVGIDVDFAYAPGFFQSGGQEVVRSTAVTTLTGNVVVALPRRLTEYSLRPYLVGGAGLMRARIDRFLAPSTVSNLAAMDFGGGATGFLTNRIGLNWDLRYFWSLGGMERGQSLPGEPEQLSFWRAHMALAIRY